MRILPQLQVTLNFVAFMAKIIDLKQFNTILVLYDRNTRNEINFVIENIPICYDIAWLLVNENDNPKFWNNTIMHNQNQLILTAVGSDNVNRLLNRLYNKNILKKRSKNLIVSNDIFKLADKVLSSFYLSDINAVLYDWTSGESVIVAWNPYGESKLVKLNETEFLRANNAAYSANGNYSGIFFDQLQNMRGRSTNVLCSYDTTNVYNVISKESVASVDGAEIQITDLIGEAIQSPMEIIIVQATLFNKQLQIDEKLFGNFLERTYRTFSPTRRRRIQNLTMHEW